MLVVAYSRLRRRRVVLMGLVRKDLRSRAKVQSRKDPVAQKERAHDEEC